MITFHRIARWVQRHPISTVLAVAFAARAVFVLVRARDPFDGVDSLEYDALARSVLSGQPGFEWSGYIRAPLYPIFVAMCYALGGVSTLIIVQIALGSATAAVVGMLAHRLHPGGPVALGAGLIAAVYPWTFQFVGTLASETLFSFLAVAALDRLFAAAASGSDPRRSIAAGALYGAGVLVRPTLLGLLPLLAAWWWIGRTARWGLIAFVLSLAATLAPFTIWNLATGNGLVVSSSQGGLNFYLGNGPNATTLYAASASDEEWLSSRGVVMTDEALRYVGCSIDGPPLEPCSEVPRRERERAFYAGAFRYITESPGEWLQTEVRKLFHYWRPWVDHRVYPWPIVLISGASFGAVAVLAVRGLALMPRRSAWFVLAFAVGATVATVAYYVTLRYRYALLDPVLISAAGVGLSELVSRLRSVTTRPVST